MRTIGGTEEMMRRLLEAAKASQVASDISIVPFLHCIAFFEGSPSGAVAHSPLDSLPGQSLEDVLGKIATRYAAAIELGLGQPGQLFVLSGCRKAGTAGPQNVEDACTDPSCFAVLLVKGPLDRMVRNL